MESLKVVLARKSELGRLWRFLNFQVRIWPRCLKLMFKNNSPQVAASLSYHTIFGIVPLAIVILLVFAWVNSVSRLGFSVKDILYKQAFFKVEYPNPDDPDTKFTLAEKVDEIVNNALNKISTGSITIIGVIFVIWAAMQLLITIEQTFNNIWHAERGRNLARRIINFWALLTLGPILAGAGIFASIEYGGEFRTSLFAYIQPLIPYIMTVIFFFCLYYFMPNTKVRFRPALWGAAMAGLAWTIAKWGFEIYVTKVIPNQAIYGIMGLIPLAVFWIYLSWLIVLFGLQLTYTTQNIKSIEDAEVEVSRKYSGHFIANDAAVINIMRFIAEAFAKKQAPVETETICAQFNITPEFTGRILKHLVEQGLLVQTASPSAGYFPATEAENIKLSDISAAVAKASFAQIYKDGTDRLKEVIEKQSQTLGHSSLKEMIS